MIVIVARKQGMTVLLTGSAAIQEPAIVWVEVTPDRAVVQAL